MKELDIGEVAKLTNIAPSALRFYEKKGLIRSVGRNGLRRQYGPDILNKLALITLGRTAGFTLNEIGEMFDAQGNPSLDSTLLLNKAKELDKTIGQLKKASEGLKHVANCSAPDPVQCPNFQKILSRARATLFIG